MDWDKELQEKRTLAEEIIVGRVSLSSVPTLTRIYDCGILGNVIVRFEAWVDDIPFYAFEWLGWMQVHTLYAEGLDIHKTL